MKRARFSEEQIVGILKEHEAGRKVAELVESGEMRCLDTSWFADHIVATYRLLG
jgi:hypothetical protein